MKATRPTIYLDHAAATPMDAGVLQAMQPYFTDKFYNPSALYLHAKSVAKDIASARAKIASWVGARPAELVFTAGGTEANNLAIHGVMQRYPDGNVIVSAIEHESVLQPARQYDSQIAPVLPDGTVSIGEVRKLIDDKTVLVSVMYANNEIGTIQPLGGLGAMLLEVRHERLKAGNLRPLYLHTDACQAANYLPLQASRLRADMLTLNGGKIYGPKQSGALYVRAGVELAPQIFGGGQEHGMRSGTENVSGIIGLSAALDLVQQDRQTEVARLQKLQKLWLDLMKDHLPLAQVNGSKKHRLPNNIHLTFSGQDNERLVMALDEAGIMCASGSACSASNDEPSHVLKAIGLSDAEAQASLRFTMGRLTEETDVRHTLQVLATLLR